LHSNPNSVLKEASTDRLSGTFKSTRPENPEGFLTWRSYEVGFDAVLVNVDVAGRNVLSDRDCEGRSVGKLVNGLD
jgi:hypothetical protein